MDELDAKRYQYLKKYIEHGDLRINGGYLTSRNVSEWDAIIDGHLKRLNIEGKFSKGQTVYVCELNPEQPLWLRQSDSREAVILDSWQGVNSQNIIYKVQHVHNNAKFEVKESYLMELNAFYDVVKPDWVESSRCSIAGITIEANKVIDPNNLVEQLINIVQLEKKEHYCGEKRVIFQLTTEFFGFKISLNKKLRYEIKRTVSKSTLLEKLASFN